MAATELDRIRDARQLDALRIVALARLGVAAVMLVASQVGSKAKWPQWDWVPWFYAVVAIGAAVLLFTRCTGGCPVTRMQLVLVVIDVTAIFIYKDRLRRWCLRAPLLVLTLLPIMVVLDVSWQRAAVALAVIAGPSPSRSTPTR